MKRILSILLSLITVFSCTAAVSGSASAASYESQLKKAGFPESYVSKLAALHKKYPKWEFVPFKTGLKFSSAVAGERSSHKNQILETGYKNKYYCSCSNCKKNGSFVYQYAGCYSASQYAVEYFMDPRNWLDEKHIFQFESNKYNESHSQSGVESIIASTWMKNANISYINTSGKTVNYTDSDGKKVKYSKAIMDAAKAADVSAYFIASRIVKEVGSTKPTASGTAGNKSPFIGMYNYYSIGATSGGMSGLEWASGYLRTDGKATLYSSYDSKTKKGTGTETALGNGQYMSYIGTYGSYYKVKLYSGTYSTNGKTGYVLKSKLRTTYFTYSRPWTSPFQSIKGGAEWIADKYLEYQYTSYLEKFNVNPDNTLYSHEYMQNVDAPSIEAESRYSAYNKAGQLAAAKTFYIPVFNNMPNESGSNASSNTTTVSGSNSDSGSANTSSQVKNLKLKGRSTTKLKIKWDKLSGATKYYIKIKNNSKGTTFDKTVTGTSTTLNNLTKGNQYSVWVRGYVNGKWGSYSKKLTARCVPSKTKIKGLTSPAKGKIKTTWAKRSGADGYQIVYSRNSDFTNVVATKDVSSSTRSYTGQNFTTGVTYYIKVRSYVKVGSKRYYSLYSKAKSVKSN